jgi:hypothetical protein
MLTQAEQYIPSSIECFLEGPAFSQSYDLAHPPPIPPSPVSKVDRRHTGRLRKRRSQIIRRQESLVLYKSFKEVYPF